MSWWVGARECIPPIAPSSPFQMGISPSAIVCSGCAVGWRVGDERFNETSGWPETLPEWPSPRRRPADAVFRARAALAAEAAAPSGSLCRRRFRRPSSRARCPHAPPSPGLREEAAPLQSHTRRMATSSAHPLTHPHTHTHPPSHTPTLTPVQQGGWQRSTALVGQGKRMQGKKNDPAGNRTQGGRGLYQLSIVYFRLTGANVTTTPQDHGCRSRFFLALYK